MAAKTPQEMIEEAAAAPRSVTGNAGSMTNHSLTETIAAARELDRRARAKTGNPFAAIGRAQIVPGGAV